MNHSKPYNQLNYKTPEDLKGVYSGCKFLIIGNGLSTGELLKYRPLLNKKFDVIIGLNKAIMDFEKEMNMYLVVEKHLDKHLGVIKYISKRKDSYNKSIKHFIFFKEIDFFRKDIELFKVCRGKFNDTLKSNIREYKNSDHEGLAVGPLTPSKLSSGSVAAQAIHLAGILGAAEIYLIGCEFMFKGADSDHYYKDNKMYRNDKNSDAHLLVEVDCNGKKYQTTEFFEYSAKFIDSLIEKDCKEAGIKVFDFSDGILKKPIKLDIDVFFK